MLQKTAGQIQASQCRPRRLVVALSRIGKLTGNSLTFAYLPRYGTLVLVAYFLFNKGIGDYVKHGDINLNVDFKNLFSK
jgi:hypothetical protein